MRQRLFNLFSALSLMLCMATLALWKWSETEYAIETHTHASGRTWIEAANLDGWIYVLYLRGFEITDHGRAAESRFTIRFPCGEGYFERQTDTTPFWDVQFAGAFGVQELDTAPFDPDWDDFPGYQVKGKCLCFRCGWIRGRMPLGGFSPFAFPPEDSWATFDAIAVPHWLLVLLFAALPAWWLWRLLSHWWRNRRKPGFCAICGYDLRASAGRCPECGAPVPEGHVPSVNQ